MDRLQFFDSISGIQYPKMIVDFFDQFICLKQIVEDTGSISVDKNTEKVISFYIDFDNKNNKDIALANVQSGTIIIYNKPILVNIEVITDTQIKINLQ